MKPLISRALVALACALSVTLCGFAFYVGAWPLALMHLFVGTVLLGAYLRPMNFDVYRTFAATGDHDGAPKGGLSD